MTGLRTTVALGLATAVVMLGGASRPAAYQLPAPSTDPLPHGADADLVRANCSGCHSLDYIATQPRGKGAQFWTDGVNKMINVYHAPVAPADAAKISAFLAATYG